MDYKKIIIYVIIILVAAGYWWKTRLDEAQRQESYERFAEIYAVTSVFATLYRNEPGRFYEARDSIYRHYDITADSMEAFRKSVENREEDWSVIWTYIRNKTDSLVKYYQANPVEHHNQDHIDTILELNLQ